MLCPDAHPGFLSFFDLSVAPPLLFYSYIPIILASLFFSLVILYKSRYSLLGKLLFVISLSFCLWVINILIQWVGASVGVVHFAWQLTALFELPIYFSSLYFFMVFMTGSDLTHTSKAWLFVLFAPVFCFLPTVQNIASFDLGNCEGVVGPLWNYIYMLEASLIGVILFFGVRNYRKPSGVRTKKEIALVTASVGFFLAVFFLSNFYGELTRVYEFNLWGPLGMVLFLGVLSYMIVKFNEFNVKLFGAQVLVAFLALLIGSEFFYIRTPINRVLTGITLALVITFGFALVRSVRKEIEQREQIERQEEELEIANARLKELDQLKSEFVSLATHQIRGPLTAIKGYASMVQEGDYGTVPENLKGIIDTIYGSSNALTVVVQDFLDVSRIEQGKMKYDFSDFDFSKLVSDVATELRPNVELKKLALTTDIEPSIMVHADAGKLRQVVENLIDNSLKYTLRGSIKVRVTKQDGKARLEIKDTGVGIKPEVLPKLFQKFSRAEDASKANLLGTGLGLYVARQLIEAQKGKVWAESVGENKGSTFIVELPLRS